MSAQRLTVLQARRIALAAQGFTRPRPGLSSDVTARHVGRVIDRLGLFQIDSVNVLVRAQYMPLFSRLGAYDVEILHRAAGRAPRRLFEYWAHEAALVDVRLWQALQFRMETGERMWGGIANIARARPEFVEWVLEEVRAHGPLTAREIEHDATRERDNWGWNWSEVKLALEYLFHQGRITAVRRNASFERLYDVPERVIPLAQLKAEPLTAPEAHRVLVGHAARALGVGSAQCLRDYFRMGPAQTTTAIKDLVESGELLPVTINGWKRPAFRHRDAVQPRRVEARALLSPFDPLVFERTRTEQLFDFRYRIEIYVPAEKRVYGYYVLPFLLGDRLVARVDLKADRASRTLIVQGAWAEDHAPEHTAVELAAELRHLAKWLGLQSVAPPKRGDLAGELTSALVSPLD